MAASAILQQHPAVVVPFPATKGIIPQEKLAEIIALRQRIESLEAELKAAEGEVRQQLDAGADIEAGLFRASIKTSERRNVAWKDVALRLAERLKLNPKAYAANVIEHTKPTVTTRLVVEA